MNHKNTKDRQTKDLKENTKEKNFRKKLYLEEESGGGTAEAAAGVIVAAAAGILLDTMSGGGGPTPPAKSGPTPPAAILPPVRPASTKLGPKPGSFWHKIRFYKFTIKVKTVEIGYLLFCMI